MTNYRWRGQYISSTKITPGDTLEDDPPPFLVEGIVHSTMTLIYGQTLAGKSTLAGALAVTLANGESEFLGHGVNADGPLTVGIISGDPGGAAEYRRRIHAYVKPDAELYVDSPDRPAQPETWHELYEVSAERAGIRQSSLTTCLTLSIGL